MSGIYQELKQPLRFYSSADKQSYARSNYFNSSNIIDLVVSRSTFMPFTLVRDGEGVDPLTSIILTNARTGATKDVTSIFNTIIVVDTSTSKGYIRYYATDTLTGLPFGTWYMTATDGVNTWVTDPFCLGDTSECIKFEYYDESDLSNFIYQYDFKNFFYIKRTLVQSEKSRSFIKEIEDTLKNRITTFHREDKIQQLEILCRMPLADAIRVMLMHSHIYLTNQLGEESKVKREDLKAEVVEFDYIKLSLELTIEDDYIIRDELYENNQITLINRNLQTETSENITTEDGTELVY